MTLVRKLYQLSYQRSFVQCNCETTKIKWTFAKKQLMCEPKNSIPCSLILAVVAEAVDPRLTLARLNECRYSNVADELSW